MLRISLFLGCFFCGLLTFGQQVPIGQWRTHLPYNSVVSIDAGDQEIYCGTKGGIFTLDKTAGELKKLSTIDGLAEINVATLAFNATTNQLMVAYENSNIDLLSGDKIYHLTDIFDKTGLGNKRINAITFKNELAYLSCGFGIVVYDLLKREVKDTYFIGNGGSNLEIYKIAIEQQNIFATTADGLYQASLNNPLLADFNSWTKHGVSQSYPGGISTSIASFDGFIYGVFGNSIYKFKDTGWQLTQIFGTDVKSLRVSENKLLTIAPFRIISYDVNENISKNIQNTANFSSANDVILDQDQSVLIADGKKGLVKTMNGTSFSNILPNGPNTIAVKELKYLDGKIILSPGAITETFAPTFNNDGFSVFENEGWTSFSSTNIPAFAPIRDVVTATEDISNQKKYLGSYFNGLVEFSADQSLKIYNQNNSSLQTTIGDPASIRVNGVVLDKENNLWVSQYGVTQPLSVKSASGQWTAFGFPDVLINPFTEVSGLLIDQNNNKWLKLRNSGIIVFNGTKYKKLGFTTNDGGIPGSNVNALILDKENAVWVGTNKGVAIFYDTENIFSGLNADIPNVVEGGFLRPLLSAENINCIAVDGANRKWIGTDNGVWLFSADGTKQILFFNKDNSPLLSNKVVTITIDSQSGEVFFGTGAGIISYKGDATEPVNKMNKITVYPNPVRPGFNGTIGIKGLSEKANVKITDINGVLVYETISNGGEATWNGKNFSGEEASSGIYLVLIVNPDGTDTAVSKILIVR
ncbi:type IX secretion system anionic LPS delivery protein PorZ [Pedobacter cryophilus]|uniref:T9SS type A sorting domain-containing protein n=1 Tax=Pedobacter cryophilus TaxID=2571271 RepID=A0A4U1C9H9_9SPHI|nr:two-component regulator propeller domain-containing protein [Pedobacter cryophilus]TKC01077.1 T9SS type A sorting domain-containing protein [Pedobacter cryophilus]